MACGPTLVGDRLHSFAIARRRQLLEIVSYDVGGQDKLTSVAIARFVFGTRTRARLHGGTKEYRYPGFIEKDGVVWLGQSVFLLTRQRSRELRDFSATVALPTATSRCASIEGHFCRRLQNDVRVMRARARCKSPSWP